MRRRLNARNQGVRIRCPGEEHRTTSVIKNQLLLLKEVGCHEHGICAFLRRERKTENLQRLLRVIEHIVVCYLENLNLLTFDTVCPRPLAMTSEATVYHHGAISTLGQVHFRSPFKL